jgi:hypothetical protein
MANPSPRDTTADLAITSPGALTIASRGRCVSVQNTVQTGDTPPAPKPAFRTPARGDHEHRSATVSQIDFPTRPLRRRAAHAPRARPRCVECAATSIGIRGYSISCVPPSTTVTAWRATLATNSPLAPRGPGGQGGQGREWPSPRFRPRRRAGQIARRPEAGACDGCV